MIPAVPATAGIDCAALLELTGGCPDLLAEIAAVFLDEAPSLVAHIERALANDDAVLLRRHAHTLGGNADALDAPRVAAPARRLEAMGRERNTAHAEPILVELRREVAAYCQSLSDLIDSFHHCP